MAGKSTKRIHCTVNGDWYERFLLLSVAPGDSASSLVRAALDGLPEVACRLAVDDGAEVSLQRSWNAGVEARGLRGGVGDAYKLIRQHMTMAPGVYGESEIAALDACRLRADAKAVELVDFADAEWARRLCPTGDFDERRDRDVYYRVDDTQMGNLSRFVDDLSELRGRRVAVGDAVGLAVMCRVVGIRLVGASPSDEAVGALDGLLTVLRRVLGDVLAERDGVAVPIAVEAATARFCGEADGVLLKGAAPRPVLIR